jgi:hypothetical protein
MLRRMSTASDAAQVIGAVATPLVALAAIGATLWTTRRTLSDKSQERLWSPRVELYKNLVEMVDSEHRRGDRLRKALTILPMDLPAAWLEIPDHERGKWHENELSVVLYASDAVGERYSGWSDTLRRLRKLTQISDAEIKIPAVEKAIEDMHIVGDQLVNEIRKELGSGRRRHGRWRRALTRLVRSGRRGA